MNTDYLEASPQSRRGFVLFFLMAMAIGVVTIEVLPGDLREVAGICAAGVFAVVAGRVGLVVVRRRELG